MDSAAGFDGFKICVAGCCRFILPCSTWLKDENIIKWIKCISLCLLGLKSAKERGRSIWKKSSLTPKWKGFASILTAARIRFIPSKTLSAVSGKTALPRFLKRTNFKIERGKNYFLSRNGSSLIAFKIPKARAEGYNIFCCHSDSPTFKIKENPERACEGAYTTLNVEFYGGRGCIPAGLIGPFQFPGKGFCKEWGRSKGRLVNFRRDMLCIPSLAPHMMSAGEAYEKVKVQKELCPLASLDKDFCLNGILADALLQKGKIFFHMICSFIPPKRLKYGGKRMNSFRLRG